MGRKSNSATRLTQAALELMWEESYGAVSIDDICKKARVQKGSFYYYYRSKSALAVAALDAMVETQKPLWDEQFAPQHPPLERILARCRFTYARQTELKARLGRVLGCPLYSLGAEICTQDDLIRAKICQIFTLMLGYWQTAIADAQTLGQIPPGDPALKARSLVAFYEGLITQARIYNDAELLRDLPALVFSHLHVRPAECCLELASVA